MTRLNQTRRKLIGYVYQPQVDNNVQAVTGARQPFSSPSQSLGELSGAGYIEELQKIIKQGSKVTNAAHQLYTSEVGTAIRNAIPDSDNTARPGYAGETHMLLKLKNGKTGVANWMGPGTEVIERTKRGDPGRTPSDTVAKRHDIDYTIAGNARTKASQLQQVRAADNRMINSLQRIKASRSDAGRNITAGLRLIQAKKIGEDLGVLDKSKFSGDLDKLSAGDSALLNNAQSELTQEGYGVLPGDALKMKMIKKMLRQSKSKSKSIKGGSVAISGSSSGQSRKRGLGKNYKLAPKPIVGGSAIGPYIAKAIPHLVKSLGLPSSTTTTITRLIPKIVSVTNSKNLGVIINKIAKNILPILAHKHLNKGKHQMSGKGVLQVIKAKGSTLVKKLADSIMKFLKGSKGSGLKLSGGGFFSDFAKGFKMVFKPGSKLLGAVATAVGVPEVGIPLSVISGLL